MMMTRGPAMIAGSIFRRMKNEIAVVIAHHRRVNIRVTRCAQATTKRNMERLPGLQGFRSRR